MEFNLKNEINDYDMVLIGLGEEFNHGNISQDDKKYIDFIREHNCNNLLPLIYSHINNKKFGESSFNEKVIKAVSNLADIIKEKNVFVVSTSINDELKNIPWKDNKFVAPCGGCIKLQSVNGDEDFIVDIEKNSLKIYFDILTKMVNGEEAFSIDTIFGGDKCFNNIYADNYNEKGYLDDWVRYTNWLQLSLNKKILILELGVGLKYPSVIRWPFEKIAFYNNKAKFVRVNADLYQLSENIAEKGISIANNAIDWLLGV